MKIRIFYGEGLFKDYVPEEKRAFLGIEDRFLRNTLIALDFLYFNDIMQVTYNKNTEDEQTVDIIDRLIAHSPEPIYIAFGERNQYFPAINTIKFNDLHGVSFRKDFRKKFNPSNVGFNSPVSLLAHELVHCYHELFDTNGYIRRKYDTSVASEKVAENGLNLSFPNKEEELVVRLTNQICEKLGEDKRGNYGRSYYLTDNVLSTNQLKVS